MTSEIYGSLAVLQSSDASEWTVSIQMNGEEGFNDSIFVKGQTLQEAIDLAFAETDKRVSDAVTIRKFVRKKLSSFSKKK